MFALSTQEASEDENEDYDDKGKIVEINSNQDVFYIKFKKMLLHHISELFKKVLIRLVCIQ